MIRPTRRRRLILAAIGLTACMPLGFVGSRLATDNFAAVATGSVYRASQMRADALDRAIKRHAIKTVLNLRGEHLDQPWYRDERATTLRDGATQVDVALSSTEWMSRAQARALVDVLDRGERPILIHCLHGSERTGVVAAFSELLRPGGTLASARAQFSWRYLFFGLGNGGRIPEHLDRYESWLAARSLPHSPDLFRRWVREIYVPERPSREYWARDPIPPVVITKPDGTRLAKGNANSIEAAPETR